MKIFVVGMLAGLGVAGMICAAPVSERNAQDVIATFLCLRYPAPATAAGQTKTAAGQSALAVTTLEPLRDSAGRTLGYIAHLTPAGFVLVRADDTAPPLKLYSTDCPFENLPPWAIEAFSGELGQELDVIERARANGQALADTYTAQWRELQAGVSRTPIGLNDFSVSAPMAGPL
ncbi:MAG: Spi family protease inhibitor, partial [bacterium]|nr:Spi family protease inhibitor [bacterium]